MFSHLLTSAALLISLPAALGQVSPTSPDSSTVVNVGDDIKALWTADSTGQWKDVEIQLMTGGNFDMIPLGVLGQGIDGTSTTSFSAPAPDVSPYSKIYFLQFTNGGDMTTAMWSTRFTIAGADGSTEQPTNTSNWNGEDVQWGTGSLVGQINTVNGGGSSNSTSTTPSNSASDPSQGSNNAMASSTPSGSASSGTGTPSGSSNMSPSKSSSESASAKTSGAAAKGAVVGGGAVLMALAGWFL